MADTAINGIGTPGRQAPSPVPVQKALQPPRLSGRNSYSLFVTSMKFLLPALATGLVLLVIAWPQIIPDQRSLGLDFSKIARDQAKNLNMLNAHFSGVDENNQPFNITADMASQTPDNEDVVELQHPKAKMQTTEGARIGISARLGHFDQEVEILNLTGTVHLTHDKGFEMTTDAATVDLKEGTAAGDSAVSGQGPAGELQAEGFRMREKGQIIVFTGKSRMLILPNAEESLK
ncbi:LPS export ABC transporter periplasmic protein LptC [Pelagibius litoralis]|uniref:LPS export ABC transporter periplasmic protein LptC n=1 Tax=Pelagibius litoralis TaxID=374515 RepID=A0A967C1T0_9PROT|nr:LPS export ABC transporter periplasmic protein LptC [Pelagibius litoralis]NIA67951.1 LPS export ABC transporter periplasmic protein LptC [Pelagibius litoralis]